MEVRFRHVPGLRKVQNNEYSIQETLSKRKLNMKGPWESAFLPGRKFNMSMIFRRPQISMSSCPGCQTENAVNINAVDADIQWLVITHYSNCYKSIIHHGLSSSEFASKTGGLELKYANFPFQRKP